jgi:SAM-dependent methyltransferase
MDTTAALRLRPLFIAVVLLGSFLLFLIQPMFARMVLPRLGGSPSVWNVAMLFYQGALLGGYLYAHALQRLALRNQVFLHLALLAVAAVFLPIAPAAWLTDPGDTAPALWLMGLLAVSIGPVFFMVSSQAPLMQAWFARSDDPAAVTPTFLYAASNAGSLAALLAYPLIVEPTTRLATQGLGWSIGFGVLLVLVGLCGVAVLRRPGQAAAATTAGVPVTNAQRLRWTLLALVPSGLLLSTTTHLTTDLMAMPLLWVIPLAAYLLSFIIAFSPGGARSTSFAVIVAPALLIFFGTSVFMGGSFATASAIAGVLLLLGVAVALHGTLAAEQPAAAQLTEFYLWVSVGGALGGLFCALIAPMIFNWGYEHPLLILAAALLLPAQAILKPSSPLASAMLKLSPLLSLGLSWLAFRTGGTTMLAIIALPIFLLAALSIGRRWLFASHLLMLMLALGGWKQITSPGVVDRTRSFFGVYATTDRADGSRRTLAHGTTVHGVQSLAPATLLRPTTYYAPESGVGRVFAAAPALFGDKARMGFVGLGSGTLACYARPGQTWTAFEIDPAIIDIARDRKLFRYIDKCKPDMKIIVGDARLMLAKTSPGSFDVLAVDAFSSDAIPLHLMTQEAFAVYGRALAPDGVLMVHITNRFLDLEPVVAAIAQSQGWSARARRFRAPTKQAAGSFDTDSNWILLARSPERLDAAIAATGSAPGDWETLRERPGMTAWSDDFSSILPVLGSKF